MPGSQPSPSQEQESRDVRHCPSLPGVTFMEARHSSSPWRVYNYEYAMGMPITWAASVMIDRQQCDMGPGDGLFVAPGEVHWTPRVKQKGDLRALLIDGDLFHRLAEECGLREKPLTWQRGFSRPSAALAGRFEHIFDTFHDVPCPMKLETGLIEYFSVLATEQLMGPRTMAKVSPRSVATRMRELIHHSPTGLTLDLSELAAAVGLNRFQALRAFKREYGMPPHAYQLSLRISRVKHLLERGESPTQAAHATGFVDQSHMTHYFKRMMGSTPGAYARSAALALFPQVPPFVERPDGVLWSF